MCLIARYSICKFKEEMHIHACKILENLIQKICRSKNIVRRETMKTYILASICIDKKNLKNFGNNEESRGMEWTAGIPDVKYRKYNKDEEFISNVNTRKENFSEAIRKLIYEDGHRYYAKSIKELNPITNDKGDQLTVSGVQVLFAEKSICVDEIVPGLAVFEVHKKEESMEGPVQIEDKNIYEYLVEEKIIPMGGFMENGTNNDLMAQMWSRNIKPFIYRLIVIDKFESLSTSRPIDYTGNEENNFWCKMHYYATGKKPSESIQHKWNTESPSALRMLGKGDWCFYARSQGICYYTPDINGDNYKHKPICFQGYAESFHLDAVILSILKIILVNYYINQIQEYVALNDSDAIKKINNNINRMYIMYDMGRTYPRGGLHYIAMEEVEDALHFQDNVKILVESTKRVEEINSSQRQEESAKRQEDLSISQEKLAKSQEKLAQIALYVALGMIIPGLVSFLNDGSSVFKDMGNPNPLLSAVISLVGIIFVIVIVVRCYLSYKKIERKNK